MNLLSRTDTSIVSNIPGTTRDIIKSKINVLGQTIEIADTAGLRDETSDEIEKIGMDRAKSEVSKSHALIIILDVSTLELNKNKDDEIVFELPS